jgi:hypothetical protein
MPSLITPTNMSHCCAAGVSSVTMAGNVQEESHRGRDPSLCFHNPEVMAERKADQWDSAGSFF